VGSTNAKGLATRAQVKTMRINWKWGIPATVVGMAVFALFAGLEYVSYRLRTHDFSAASAKIKAMDKQLQYVLEKARKDSFPLRRFDHSSVGSAHAEAKLLEIRRDIGSYESINRHLPVNFSELESVGFPPNWKEDLEKFGNECQVIVLTSDSDILNCDGWTRPSASDLKALVRSFDPQTERFYKVQGHVLLFVPPLTR
jgi:hypothetical protein